MNNTIENEKPYLGTGDGIDRRHFLECMKWAGTGLLWSIVSGVPTAKLLAQSATGASSQSLLWNLYRRQTAADGSRKTSFLFGLFQHRKSAEGTVVKLFYIPVSKAGT